MFVNWLKVLIKVYDRTLMAVELNQPPPYLWGNRVILDVDKVGPVRVLNMTIEHLDAAENGWTADGIVFHTPILEDAKVWISLWEEGGAHWCLINDGRIPKSWYEKRLMWGSSVLPSTKMATAIYEHQGGDHYGELEQFTDPVSYWLKRGYDFVIHDGVRALREPPSAPGDVPMP